jgi:hypothetical protein
LPEGEFAPAELRTARRALRTFANEVEREGDKFPEVSSYYVNRAIEALRLDGNVDAAKYADILENISNKRDLLSSKRTYRSHSLRGPSRAMSISKT